VKAARKHYKSTEPTRGGAPGEKYLNQHGLAPHAFWDDGFGCPVVVCPIEQWGRDLYRPQLEGRVARLLTALAPLEAACSRTERSRASIAALSAAQDAGRLAAEAIPDGHKRCPTCKKVKPLGEFAGIKRKVYCNDCNTERVTDQRAAKQREAEKHLSLDDRRIKPGHVRAPLPESRAA
jgi:hypothetical protein